MTIARWLQRAAQAHPHLPALAHGVEATATYAEFVRRVAALARHLRKSGCAQGQPVVIWSENTPEFFEALFACFWGGYVAAPLEPGYSPAQVAQVVEHSRARFAFMDQRRATLAVKGDWPGLRKALVFGQTAYLAARDGEGRAPAKISAAAPAWLYYGPQPEPGAALRASTLTHRSLMAMTRSILAEVGHVEPRQAQIHVEPAALQSGLFSIVACARGGLNVCPASGDFDDAEIAELSNRWRQAGLFLTPANLARLARSDVDFDRLAFRGLYYGGPPATPRRLSQAIDRFGARLVEVFGVKEAPLALSRLTCHDVADRSAPTWAARAMGIGRPYLDTELKVVGPGGEASPTGRVGEIWARGPALMTGYWREPKATAAAFSGKWLKTGLYGEATEGGWLTLRSRPSAPNAVSELSPRSGQRLVDAERLLLEAANLDDVALLSGGAEPGTLYYVGEEAPERVAALAQQVAERFGAVGRVVRCEALPRTGEGDVSVARLRRFDREGAPACCVGAQMVAAPASEHGVERRAGGPGMSAAS